MPRKAWKSAPHFLSSKKVYIWPNLCCKMEDFAEKSPVKIDDKVYEIWLRISDVFCIEMEQIFQGLSAVKIEKLLWMTKPRRWIWSNCNFLWLLYRLPLVNWKKSQCWKGSELLKHEMKQNMERNLQTMGKNWLRNWHKGSNLKDIFALDFKNSFIENLTKSWPWKASFSRLFAIRSGWEMKLKLSKQNPIYQNGQNVKSTSL